MRVDVNYVLWLRSEMDKINEVSFNEIEWFDGNKKLDVDPKIIEDWKFVGMTNCSFVETGFFLEDPNATWEQRDKVWKDNGEKMPLGKPLIPKCNVLPCA